MMKHIFSVLVIGLAISGALVAACSGNSPPPTPDAAHGTLGFGAMCMIVSDTSTECASGVCTNSFNLLTYNVCSVKCTFGNDATCPSGSAGMKCNMKGYCKP